MNFPLDYYAVRRPSRAPEMSLLNSVQATFTFLFILSALLVVLLLLAIGFVLMLNTMWH